MVRALICPILAPQQLGWLIFLSRFWYLLLDADFSGAAEVTPCIMHRPYSKPVGIWRTAPEQKGDGYPSSRLPILLQNA